MIVFRAINARQKHPEFPFSYDKICKIAAKLKIKNYRISHSEDVNDLIVKIYDGDDVNVEEVTNLLNSEYSDAGFEIWKSK